MFEQSHPCANNNFHLGLQQTKPSPTYLKITKQESTIYLKNKNQIPSHLSVVTQDVDPVPLCFLSSWRMLETDLDQSLSTEPSFTASVISLLAKMEQMCSFLFLCFAVSFALQHFISLTK